MWQKSFHAKTSCGKSNTKNFTVHLHNCSTFSISLRSFAVLHRVHHKEEDDENGSARFVSFFFVLTSNAALSARFHCLASTRIDWKFEIFRKLITFSELIAAYKRIFIICNRRWFVKAKVLLYAARDSCLVMGAQESIKDNGRRLIKAYLSSLGVSLRFHHHLLAH